MSRNCGVLIEVFVILTFAFCSSDKTHFCLLLIVRRVGVFSRSHRQMEKFRTHANGAAKHRLKTTSIAIRNFVQVICFFVDDFVLREENNSE